jgi:diguanylate cyclase (GGDEF)-like protein
VLTAVDDAAWGVFTVDAEARFEYKRVAGDAFTDSLTGLYDHGLFRIILDRELVRSRRTRDSFALVFIDIDSFPLFNEQIGPAKSDGVLRRISRLIRENIRDVDFAARFGGSYLTCLSLRASARTQTCTPLNSA